MLKKYLFLFFFLYAPVAVAQTLVADGVQVRDLALDRRSDTVSLSLVLDVSSLKIKGARSLALTPVLKAPGQTLDLPSVEIMGGKQYIYYMRNKNNGATEVHRRNSGVLQQIPYTASFPHEPWMDNAAVYLSAVRRHCCKGSAAGETLLAQAAFAAPAPDRLAADAARIRSVKGTAYVDFPVNRWEVKENFRNNASELYKIFRTIEEIRASQDYAILAIRLTGYASVESSWLMNAKLAKKRSEALKEYICEHLSIPQDIVHVRSVAEDWEGLRDFVQKSYLFRKDDLLSLIDSDIVPDHKEMILKMDFPAQYRILERDCFPLLRRTQYEIEYQIKTLQNEN